MPDQDPVEQRPGQYLPGNSFWVAGVFFVALLLLFHQTVWSMVSIWMRSDTFAHGFLILPIALWMIWRKGHRLENVVSPPLPWVVLLMVLPGFIWLVAWLVDVLVVQQLALVAMLIIGCWAILGTALARELAFPLLFLFLAVPMGEALVAPMMEFTATSTVWLIQHSGIPVYREGLYFSLPSGNWSVVEACSGVRYIIASITLGVLYAYLTYTSLWRRVLFILVSAIVPIFANTARAYIIVMLGHFSDMTIATGVDHLIYGWVFFGLVIFLMFWLGSFFREDEQPVETRQDLARLESGQTEGTGRLVATGCLAFVVAVAWPVLAAVMQSGSNNQERQLNALPSGIGSWQQVSEPDWDWQPPASVVGQQSGLYALNEHPVALFLQYRNGPEDAGEVVGSSGRFTDIEDPWRVASQIKRSVSIMGTPAEVDQAVLRRGHKTILAWSWYQIGSKVTSNDYIAKLWQALASLGLGDEGSSYRFVIATPVAEEGIPDAALLQAYLDDSLTAIVQNLHREARE